MGFAKYPVTLLFGSDLIQFLGASQVEAIALIFGADELLFLYQLLYNIPAIF